MTLSGSVLFMHGNKELIAPNYTFKDVLWGTVLEDRDGVSIQTFRTPSSLPPFPIPGKAEEKAQVLHPWVQVGSSNQASPS